MQRNDAAAEIVKLASVSDFARISHHPATHGSNGLSYQGWKSRGLRSPSAHRLCLHSQSFIFTASTRCNINGNALTRKSPGERSPIPRPLLHEFSRGSTHTFAEHTLALSRAHFFVCSSVRSFLRLGLAFPAAFIPTDFCNLSRNAQ